jgi:predicted phage tail protein
VANATNAVVLRPHPFSQDHGVAEVEAGQTLRRMLEALAGGEVAGTVYVEIGGREVPRALWAHVRPKPGTTIHVTRMPAGGDSGKKLLRTVLMVVVAVVAMWVTSGGAAGWLGAGFGAGTTGAMVLGAAVYMVGDLRVPALTPESIE